ncbi:efflux RND transporter permease subunit [Paenibacillus cremeus]|uniref:Efflux RND transporter permease subunit n=1 Tax=Paenibacillus cremeus TaxID=2163881 RepID=A0A559JGH7_9BACL|nr:efflux RND transporter permease subunit [Paenibacillus cremeus]TVX98973.1 efflux RND transporter permease subunit [Paenibacillus cremeus]
MSKLIEATMNRTFLIITALLIIAIWGGMSSYQIQEEYLPPINNPTLMVSVHAQDFQAEQIKASVLAPIQHSVRKVVGLETLESNSFDGGLLISLYFPVNFDISRAESEVASTLEHIALPAGVDKPLVTRISTSSFPMMRLSLTSPSGKVDEAALRTEVQARISNELKSISGVSDVRVIGAARNGYSVSIRMADLNKYGLSLEDVKRSLAEVHPTWVQGRITTDQVTIPLQAADPNQSEQDLKQLPIRGEDGRVTPLSAIADLSKSMLDVQTISRTYGAPSVIFDVLKTPSSNITDISGKLLSRIQDIPGLQTGDLQLSVLLDQGEQVKAALHGLLKEGLLGSLLSMVCVFLFFRNKRSTALVALSLPICLLGTAGLLNAMGISLNILTVSGLIVAMGRVIDDTIVILDNMYRKASEQQGKLTSTLLAEAVTEMLPAIISSTATTVAVYIPIAVVGGMISSAFSGFAWSVVIALLTSLLVAMFVVPALYHMCYKGRPSSGVALSIEQSSVSLLDRAFRRKGRILAGFCVLLLVAGAGAIYLPVNFLPASRSGQINVQLEFPEGTVLTQIDSTVKRMEQVLKSDTGISTFSSVLGSTFTPQFDDVFDAGGGWVQSASVANIAVSLNRNAEIDQVMSKLQTQLASLSGIAVCTVTNQNISGDDSQLKIDLSGADTLALETAAKLVRTQLQHVQGLSVAGAVNDKEGAPGFHLSLDRNALEQAGVEPQEVYKRVREYVMEGTRIDLPTAAQSTIPLAIHTDLLTKAGNAFIHTDAQTDILTLLGKETFKGKDGRSFRLDSLASLNPGNGPAVIRERDGRPFAQVTANITSRDVEKVVGQVKDQVGHLALPPGVQYTFQGISTQVNQMIYEMTLALSVSVLLVVLVLSTVFKGWRAPLAVFICIPLAFIGSVIGMLLTGREWNLASLVGLLMLSGIVATNGIVLVDKIERNLAGGMSAMQAILQGTAARVRPVLMTAVTTVLTLLPLCFFGGGDTVVSQSLGIVVVCGMVSSTLISLLGIPMLYEWLHSHRTATAQTGTELGHSSQDINVGFLTWEENA